MSLEQKQTVVSEVAAKLGNAQAVIVAEYRGLEEGEEEIARGLDREGGQVALLLPLDEYAGEDVPHPDSPPAHPIVGVAAGRADMAEVIEDD